jgi:hypothetical protein
MRRVALAVLVLIPLGCSGGADEDRTPLVTHRAETPPNTRDSREAAIYASVLRQLVTKDHTFGGGDPGFKVVYVMGGVMKHPEALNGSPAASPAEPFDTTVKAKLHAALADLPPLRFVPRWGSVIVGTSGPATPGYVKNMGVLISLGPIRGRGNRVKVGNSLFITGLAAQWLTYVVENENGVWKVVGTTGPVAIS